MIFIDYLNTKNFLNEAMSSEFKGLVHPSLFKTFGDLMSGKGLSIQKANFRELTDREKSTLKRVLSEKNLSSLPYGARFVVAVYPKNDDKIERAKNPDSFVSGSVGEMFIIDRLDGTITNLSADIRHNFLDDEYKLQKVKIVPNKTTINDGVNKIMKRIKDDPNFKCFILDASEDNTRSQRQKVKEEIHDVLKPFPWGDQKNMQQIEREKEAKRIKDTALVEKTHDEFMDAIRQTKDEIDETLGSIISTGKRVKMYINRDKCLDISIHQIPNIIKKLDAIKEAYYSETSFYSDNALTSSVPYAKHFVDASKLLKSIKVK